MSHTARQRPAWEPARQEQASGAVDPSEDDRRLPTARGVLTKAEIAALLRPDLPDHIGRAVPPAQVEPRVIPPLDAQLLDPVEQDTRRQAEELAARLALAFGRNTGLKAAIVLDEVAQTETRALPGLMRGKTAAIACFGTSELNVTTLVCLPGTLADTLIARACGASGSTGRSGEVWRLSAIDCALLEQLIAPLGAALGDGVSLQSIETDVPYVVSTLPQGGVCVAEFGVEASEFRSEIAVISAQLPLLRKDGPALRHSEVPLTALVTARIARLSVPLSRLTELKAGATLVLGLPPDQPVEVLNGGRTGEVVFEGQLGRKGKQMAVRIASARRSVLNSGS